MPRKRPRPDSNGRLLRLKDDEKILFFRLPRTLKEAIRRAAEHESAIRGHRVSDNEWITRAAIDRIGEIFGDGTARMFYQQFFNGVVAIRADIKLPTTDSNGDTNHPA